ncbi:MAG: hypothetical protein CVV58_07510, partial [Tenericutes bacterium HGW-Tenericutes-3]
MESELDKLDLVSKLDVALSEADSLRNVIKIGLPGLLELLNQENGGIFIPKTYKKREPIWLTLSPLDSWVDGNRDISAHLLYEITNFIEGKSREERSYRRDFFQLIPLYWKQDIQAIIVLDSKEIAEFDLALIQLVGNMIARELHIHQTKVTTISSEQYLTTLRIISATQSSELNLNDVQLWILKGIKDTFKGEMAGLVLVDLENPSIAQKRMVGSGSEWLINDTIRFEKGILKNCVEKSLFYQVIDVLNDQLFDYETDSCRDITQRSMICSPIIVNSITVGVITIYNSPHTPLDAFDQGLLVSLTTSLANSIYNNQLIQQLKIAN